MTGTTKRILIIGASLLLLGIVPALVLAQGSPHNDYFANAEEIFGRSGNVGGSNAGAGIEPGEPTHFGYGNRYSVWYKWTAPVNGTATFTFDSSSSSIYYGIVLGVYTGSSVSELNAVAGGLVQSNSSAVFGVAKGTTYYICVSGCDYWETQYGQNLQGNFVLNWNVEMLTPEVYEWPDSATAIIYGDPLSASTLSGGSASVPGAFEFVDPNYVPPAAGTCSAGVKFVPADQDTYDIVTGGIVTVPVNRAPLTITAENKSKIYGDPDPVFTASYDGFKLGDTPAAVSGLTFSREPGEDVGEYTITPSGATASNYDISYASGTLTIEPAPLTITADDKSKTYGDDDPVFTASYSGFKRGDTAAVVSGLTFSREAGEDVGEYTITPSGATASNYTITFASGTLTISPAPLTIKADDKSKTYGDDDPAFTVSYSGFKRGETAAVVSGLVISRAEGEDAGQYAIIPSGATASNYTITFESGTLTINPAPLTIKADDKSKVYGDADPAFTVSYSGFKLGDTAAVVSGLTFNREEGEDVGQYVLTPSGATADNYTITFVSGTLTINPAPLTITADDKSKTYGDDDPAFTVSYEGFRRGDTASVVSGLTFSREAGEDVGEYAITPSGATASNYTITFVSGTLTINPAPLTITADDKSKTYGDDDPVFTASYSGFKRGDTAAVVSGLNISREAGENVGQYAITPSGATAGNYTITFVDGTLTINPAPLTITADDKSKTYGDDDPAFTVSYEGFRRGDTAAVVSGLNISREAGENVGQYAITPSGATAGNYIITFVDGTLTINPAPLTITADDKSKTYGDDDPALTVSYDGFKRGDTAAVVSGLNISREAGENVGQYAITPSGATASNYTITFVDGTLTINPAPLTITADDKSKTYGDDDPAFTVSYEGFRRGDTASVVSGLNISREAGENVGQYAITPSGATAGNYTITFVNGTLTINPAPLTITADDKSKVYGDPDPAFTASYDGFKLGDTAGVVSGLAFSREEGEDVGTYTITPYGATASNYAITFESGTLTINKATPLVTAWPQAAPIIYGDMLGSSSLTGGEASVPGSFAFVYPEACPEAGLQSVAVTFIPEDTHNYNSVSGTVEIAVKYMLSINPDTGGSVSGAGEYLPGEEVQIKAEPAVGYRFVCWMEGGAIIGDDAEMSITLSDHRILRAVFWEYDTEKTWSQKDIGTTDNKATVDFHDGKVSMEINSPGEITDGQIDVTLYDADAEKGAPEGMVPAGIYLRIERTDNFAGSTVRLVVKYDPAELPEDVEETSLKLYRFVPGTGWVEVSPQGVNKAEKYIWAELTGFSTFAVFGEVSPSEDLPKTEGTQVYLAVLAALFAIGGLFALLRRKLAKEN